MQNTFVSNISSFLFILACNITFGQDYSSIDHFIKSGQEEKALDLLNKISNKSDLPFLNYMGEVLLRKGRYDEAKDKFEQAEYTLLKSGNPDPSTLANTYSNIAIVNWTTGNDALALQYHFKSLEIREELQDEMAIAGSMNDIGLTYSKTDPDNALAYYKKALTAYKKAVGEMDDKTATAFVNIGIAYNNLNLNEEALDNLKKALEIRVATVGKGSSLVAFVHASLGKVYSEMNESEAALQEFEIALGIYKSNYGEKHPEIASTFYLIGNVLHPQGKFVEALTNYQHAIIANLKDYQTHNIYDNPSLDNYYNADLLLSCLYQKALAFEDLHTSYSLKISDLTMAYVTLEKCDQLIDDIRQFRTSESDKVALGKIASEVYESSIRVSLLMAGVKWKKKEYYEKAFYYADKSKSAVLLDAINDTKAKDFAGIPADLLDQENLMKSEVAYYEQKLAGKLTPDLEKQYRQLLFDWTKNYNELIASLEIQYPTYYDLKYSKSIPTIAEIQEKLDSDQALLSYFVAVDKKRLYLYLVTNKRFEIADVALLDDYDRNISGYRNAMYYNAPNTYRETATKLYQQLFPLKIPGTIKTLTIIPSGRIATIPFEALIESGNQVKTDDSKAAAYLINRYNISYEYASSLYMNQSEQTSGKETIALFAPVDFQSRTLSNLPGTEKEVEDIGNLFAGSSSNVAMYIREKANRDEVRSTNVAKSKYLHFATHGIIDENKPERSQICLAADSDLTGSLYSGDIYSLKLNADLVVLSACETGLGKISKGEGIIGLSRALIYAGSNNLIVSLWRVNDNSTSLLMTDFYRSMIQGNSYAVSLRMAKQGLIKSREFSSPYYWAPFVLIGH